MASLDTLSDQMADMSSTDIFNFILIGITIGMILSMIIIVYMCKAIRSRHYSNIALNYCPTVITSKKAALFNAVDSYDNDIDKIKEQ
ncbi:Nuclear envelope integral membrane protein 1a [Dirofilaria immitis]